MILIFFVSSCGGLRILKTSQEKQINITDHQEMSAKDFSSHLSSLKKSLLNTPGTKVARNKRAKAYLEKLALGIIEKNEIFFKRLKRATVTLIQTKTPLHFSLPEGELFLSTGLISKYITHESVLVGILSFELVRSEGLLYPRQTLVPTGHVPLERFLSFSRLSLDEKIEIHKWAYYLSVRSGFEGEYYLSWLQIQNRNTADFLTQVGDASMINREESLFKSFLINTIKKEQLPGRKNSSKAFYRLLNDIRNDRS